MIVTNKFHLYWRSVVLALLYALAMTPIGASAQWQWIDGNGQKVFSDRPPGNDVPEKNILQRPKPEQLLDFVRPTTTNAPGPTPAAKSTASAPVDKNKAVVQELSNQLADQNKAIKARNCADARRQLASLKSGVRIAKINEKGEREFLDDAAVAAELKQTQRVADSECQ